MADVTRYTQNVDSEVIRQVRPSLGTDVYPHMPIIRPHAARSCVREPKGNRCERRGGGGGLPIRSILGFWGSKVHKNDRFPALDADEPPCKI